MSGLTDYTITANDLQNLDIPQANWVIPDLIPEGLTLLAGRPKIGKSWMALNMAYAIAKGENAFGRYATNKSTVLFITYEDNHRRLQERLLAVCNGNGDDKAPENLLFLKSIYTFPKLNDGGLNIIEESLIKNEEIKCVIIDTFGSAIKNDGKKYGYAFHHDYEIGSTIQELASKYQAAFILLHHTRKYKSGDPYEDIVGTTGLTASPDTLLVLEKNPAINMATLSIIGRDVKDGKLGVEFNNESSTWIAKDDLPDYHTTKERMDIVELFNDDSTIELKSGDIAKSIGKSSPATSNLLKKLLKEGILIEASYGSYKLNKPNEEENLTQEKGSDIKTNSNTFTSIKDFDGIL
jgi:hypothetical protein